MIFLGDFAQLPPPMKTTPLYGIVSQCRVISDIDMQSCIGKSLWLQCTTIVILRENMWQTTQSNADANLRTALGYKLYSNDDIRYLCTLLIIYRPNIFLDIDYQLVPIITALNIHRDEINSSGAERFASDTGTALTWSHSVDQWGSSSRKSKLKGFINWSSERSNSIPSDIQTVLWALPPAATDHVPGILALSKGLPMQIKYNEATEGCVTNGTEAIVLDWISHTQPSLINTTLTPYSFC